MLVLCRNLIAASLRHPMLSGRIFQAATQHRKPSLPVFSQLLGLTILRPQRNCQLARLQVQKGSQYWESIFCAHVHWHLPSHPRTALRSGPRFNHPSCPASAPLFCSSANSQRAHLFVIFDPLAYHRGLQYKLPVIKEEKGAGKNRERNRSLGVWG